MCVCRVAGAVLRCRVMEFVVGLLMSCRFGGLAEAVDGTLLLHVVMTGRDVRCECAE